MIESLLLQTVEQSASNAKGMHWYKKCGLHFILIFHFRQSTNYK